MTYRAALLGFGYWGKNLARNLDESGDFDLSCIADVSSAALDDAARRYPASRRSDDPAGVASGDDVDLVVVASPLDTHANLVRLALEGGKHVLVTKPFVSDAEVARELVALASANQRTLMVDHTFVYSAPVRRMKEILDDGRLGPPLYCSSLRVNLGTFRGDANVVWDLAPHDLSILNFLLDADPIAVVATGGLQMGSGVEQFAHLTAYYPKGFIAQLNLSWLAPVKVRLMHFGGQEQMLVYDDLDLSAPLKVYDKSLAVTVEAPASGEASFAGVIEYRVGDMWAPHIERSEALAVELRHLAEALRIGSEVITSGASAVSLTAALQAADVSIRQGGRLQVLDPAAWADEAFVEH